MRDHPLPRQPRSSGVCNYLSTPLQLGNKDVLLRLLFLFCLTFGLVKQEKELRNQQTATQSVLLTGTFSFKKIRTASQAHKQNQEEQGEPTFSSSFLEEVHHFLDMT